MGPHGPKQPGVKMGESLRGPGRDFPEGAVPFGSQDSFLKQETRAITLTKESQD